MNKDKLIVLRCKAWGITKDEYYIKQCGDFTLEDMAKAYRRGKNNGAEFGYNKAKEILGCENCCEYNESECGSCVAFGHFKCKGKALLTEAREIIKKFSEFVNLEIEYDPEHPEEYTKLWNELCEQAGQFLKEIDE